MPVFGVKVTPPDAILASGSVQVLVGSGMLIRQHRRVLRFVFLSLFRVVVTGADALRGSLAPCRAGGNGLLVHWRAAFRALGRRLVRKDLDFGSAFRARNESRGESLATEARTLLLHGSSPGILRSP